VQNHSDGLALCGVLAKKVHNCQGLRGIKSRDGFVRQHHRSLNGKRTREQNAGAFAA